MSYNAIIARIKTRPHPNADRLLLGDVLGNTVVVSKDTVDESVGVYFPPDGILSPSFLQANNLYNKSAILALGLPEPPSYGFFDAHGRVRAQKFRGEKSEGIWLPLSSLGAGQGDVDKFEEGYQFDHWGGVRICEKWTTQKKQSGAPNQSRNVRKGEVVGFPKHLETEQWRYCKDQIPVGSILTITEKLHGTSHRFGLVKVQRRWWEFWKRNRWERFDGSRNVILTAHSGRTSFYGTDQFRFNATQLSGVLRKGEVVFGEIVGWVNNDTPIMPPGKVEKKELQEIYEQYGPVMHWSYGCKEGEAKFYIYRIVQFNEDGEGVELSWPQVQRRAQQLGFSTPKHIMTGSWMAEKDAQEILSSIVERATEGESLENQFQIREGVVVRVDTPDGHTYYLKNKSFAFKVLEGIIKSVEGYEDVEESA